MPTKPTSHQHAAAAVNAGHLGAVSTAEVYPLEVFKKLTGLDKRSIATAKREGLKVVKVGRRVYVRGSAFNDYLALKEAAEAARD